MIRLLNGNGQALLVGRNGRGLLVQNRDTLSYAVAALRRRAQEDPHKTRGLLAYPRLRRDSVPIKSGAVLPQRRNSADNVGSCRCRRASIVRFSCIAQVCAKTQLVRQRRDVQNQSQSMALHRKRNERNRGQAALAEAQSRGRSLREIQDTIAQSHVGAAVGHLHIDRSAVAQIEYTNPGTKGKGSRGRGQSSAVEWSAIRHDSPLVFLSIPRSDTNPLCSSLGVPVVSRRVGCRGRMCGQRQGQCYGKESLVHPEQNATGLRANGERIGFYHCSSTTSVRMK